MGLKTTIRRHRKDTRWIVGVLSLLLVFLTAIFYALQRGAGLPAALLTNKILLFVLFYVNIVLILAILFVLFRNLLKLAVERRHGFLGSKFKTKLVATYIGLSLIPVLLLFAIAFEIVQGSTDRWFDPAKRRGLEAGRDIAQALKDRIERNSFQAASLVADAVAELDPEDVARRPVLTRRLQELLGELDLDFLAVYRGVEFVTAVIDPEAGILELPELGRSFLAEAASEEEAVGSLSLASSPQGGPGGLLVFAARSVERIVPAAETPSAVVVAGSRIEPRLTERMNRLIQDYQAYRQLEVQRDEIEASQLLFFLMVTLLILLASSWAGLYLARRVTVPIQALAEGTRRISRGELSHRVEVEADDELGTLVDSFNRMTGELERNRKVIEQSHLEVLATNERLAEERALIGAVLQNVAAGVISINAEERIFTCNGAALAMLRQDEEEVLGRPLAEAWSDAERSKLVRLLRELATSGDRGSRNVHLVLGGEWRTFEVKLTLMHDGGGRTTGWVVVLEDLSELIKAQQQAAWSEAARRIAHEIKNPLTPIRLSAERLLKKYEDNDAELGETLEEAVEIIVREVGTMQTMVDEFSRYARMPRPQPAEVDLDQLLEETLHLYRDVKPGVEVSGRVDEEAKSAWLDAEQVKRALINLLDNALEATQPPGRVTVAAGRRDGYLEIRVADTGKGIPRQARDKLFLPHFSTKGRGTGLGLAIVHRIVSDHQGSIRVEDNQPRGTVFTLELPLH